MQVRLSAEAQSVWCGRVRQPHCRPSVRGCHHSVAPPVTVTFRGRINRAECLLAQRNPVEPALETSNESATAGALPLGVRKLVADIERAGLVSPFQEQDEEDGCGAR